MLRGACGCVARLDLEVLFSDLVIIEARDILNHDEGKVRHQASYLECCTPVELALNVFMDVAYDAQSTVRSNLQTTLGRKGFLGAFVCERPLGERRLREYPFSFNSSISTLRVKDLLQFNGYFDMCSCLGSPR